MEGYDAEMLKGKLALDLLDTRQDDVEEERDRVDDGLAAAVGAEGARKEDGQALAGEDKRRLVQHEALVHVE